jgi:hypothetical protein
VFRPEPIARLLREHMDGKVDHSYRLWLLLNLEIWHELYIEGRSIDAVREQMPAFANPQRGGTAA